MPSVERLAIQARRSTARLTRLAYQKARKTRHRAWRQRGGWEPIFDENAGEYVSENADRQLAIYRDGPRGPPGLRVRWLADPRRIRQAADPHPRSAARSGDDFPRRRSL